MAGKMYRPVEFEDLYIGQCQKEGITPASDILSHFNKCADWMDYNPKHCDLNQALFIRAFNINNEK